MAAKNPNAILRRIRSSVVTLGQNSPAATPPDVHELIQAVKDLDNHLSWGGAQGLRESRGVVDHLFSGCWARRRAG
jgi:hypothetical protein